MRSNLFLVHYLGTILVTFFPISWFIYKLAFKQWPSLESFIYYNIFQIPFVICCYIGLILLSGSLALIGKSKELHHNLIILYLTSLGIPMYFVSVGDATYVFYAIWFFLGDLICFIAISLFIINSGLIYKEIYNGKKLSKSLKKGLRLSLSFIGGFMYLILGFFGLLIVIDNFLSSWSFVGYIFIFYHGIPGTIVMIGVFIGLKDLNRGRIIRLIGTIICLIDLIIVLIYQYLVLLLSVSIFPTFLIIIGGIICFKLEDRGFKEKEVKSERISNSL